MSRRARSFLVSLYLLACIMFGGSSQGMWTNLGLQLLGIVLIAWAALASEPADEGRKPAFIYLLIGLAGLTIFVQLIPLPQSFWSNLPGRSWISEGLAMMGLSDVWLPLSLTPYQTVLTMFAAIPGLAVFVAAKMLRPAPRWIAAAIVAGMTIGIGLGAAQVASAGETWARFYRFTSPGAVGTFANVNHMATLLLATIPFGVALLVATKSERTGARQAKWLLAIGGLILVTVGIALNGSRAALALAVPVLLASAALVPAALRLRRVALPVAVLALVGGIVLLASAPVGSQTDEAGGIGPVQSRQQIWATTTSAISDTFPAGSGLGSFRQVYRQFEDPAEISPRYVNHAHNDYLELVLEMGAPGLILILLFLGWWGLATARIWTSSLSTPFERAATIASAAILAHSIVDFPLRTAAIMAVFGIAIALMTQPLRSVDAESSGRRRSRHVKLG